MARISFPTPDTMNAAQLKVYGEIVGGKRGTLVGPLRAALHNPELADRWQRFGAALRFETSLPRVLTELAILVTARRWNSQIEFLIHSGDGAKAGLAADVIEALRVAAPPRFTGENSDAERDVYEFARQIQMYGDVAEDVYQRVLQRWQAVGVVELTAVIGYYTMVSMTLNAHQIPLPEGAQAPLEPVPGARASASARERPGFVVPGGGFGGLTDLPPTH